MIILCLRTDKPDSEIGIFKDTEQLSYETWLAHRQLAETLHKKIADHLQTQKLDWTDIDGIVVYEGPGSFTGLRIGMSLANALARGLPVRLVTATGKDWLSKAINRLLAGADDKIGQVRYGSPVRITIQKR